MVHSRNTYPLLVNDVVNELAAKLEEADGLVIASPVYYASAAGTLVSCLDRLFYSTGFDKTMKVGAAVCVARRGGLSATFDELNKYFSRGDCIPTKQVWDPLPMLQPQLMYLTLQNRVWYRCFQYSSTHF